jgi:hypothetical protein
VPELPTAADQSKFRRTVDCNAHTLAIAVDGRAPVIVLHGIPAGRYLYPAVFVLEGCGCMRIRMHYSVVHVRFVVRTRVMCQAARARAAGASGDVSAWLCERAPLWIAVHVCALLRDY